MFARLVLVAALTAPLTFSEAGAYENARFGYVIELPAGFSEVAEADNSDGGVSRSADGTSEIAVWGSNLLDETLASDARSRIASDEADGWSVSYRSVRRAGASWSGAMGGRIFYARALPGCADQSVYFRIEYPAAQARRFDAVVKRLVRGFRATKNCL